MQNYIQMMRAFGTGGQEGVSLYEGISSRCSRRKAFFLEESGNYYLRNSWEKMGNISISETAVRAEVMDITTNFILMWCVRGEDVLVDSGRYSYNFEQENRIWLKSAHAYNTILVDKKDYLAVSDDGERKTQCRNFL